MFSLLKIKHTKQMIVVKSSNVSRKRKKDYWIKLENGKRCVGIFFYERHTLLEIKNSLDTSSPKVIIKDINKLSDIQCANSETTCNKNKVISNPHSQITESVLKSNPDTNIKKLIYDQLDKENDENVNSHLIKTVLKCNAKILRSQCSNSKTKEMKERMQNHSPKIVLNEDCKRKAKLSIVQYINTKPECNTNKESNFSKTVDAEIQNNTDTNTKELNYDLLGYEQINIINDNTFDSNIEMINQVQNQHKDPNNITNSYLDLDVESDFYYNDKFQADITTNKNLKSSVLDQTKSSRNYPRIIENKKCKINMLVLPKRLDSR
ncbi:uncharacterized protein [Linepithema humile]|uniref:uncharacterized protein isoform X2 n=1 Tax=Linepithema humile TaxID=83485 RepID=UPI00351E3A5E